MVDSKIIEYLCEVLHTDDIHPKVREWVVEEYFDWTLEDTLKELKQHSYEIKMPTTEEIMDWITKVCSLECYTMYVSLCGKATETLWNEHDLYDDLNIDHEYSHPHQKLHYFICKKAIQLADMFNTCPLEVIGSTDESLNYMVVESAYKELIIAHQRGLKENG